MRKLVLVVAGLYYQHTDEDAEQMAAVVRGAYGKRPKYADFVSG